MEPNKRLSGDMNPTDTFTSSRSHSFLDSYIYMKNRNYNALYDKNKKIMMVENDAISNNSPIILYNAFLEQLRILDSVIYRVQSFITRQRQYIIQDIMDSIPNTSQINRFQTLSSNLVLMPKFKYVKYKVVSINYPNMDQFLNKFKQEIIEYCKITDDKDFNKPLLHSKATNYLTNVNIKYANYDDSLFEIEEIKILDGKRINEMISFLRKSKIYLNIINKDCKTFIKYLNQFDILSKISDIVRPSIINNSIVLNIDGKDYFMTFNDYLILYKHFSSMMKYILEIVNLYNNKFFNKIYAIQTNIQVYKSIMDDVTMYANNTEREISDNGDTDIEFVGNNMIESSYDYMNQYKDVYDLINGNDEADMLLHDDTECIEDIIDNKEDCNNALDKIARKSE